MRQSLFLLFAIICAACDRRPSGSSPVSADAGCDVTIVPGERIGDEILDGDEPLRARVEPGKTYCAPWLKFRSGTTLAEVRAAAPAGCATNSRIGATQIVCRAQGTSFTFTGPMSVLASVSVFRKDPSDSGR
jgi:hypothetical protein